MQRLVAVLDTGAGPNFITESEFQDELRTLILAGSPPNICDVSKNPLRKLETVGMLVHLGHTRAALRLTVFETMAAAAIFGADF